MKRASAVVAAVAASLVLSLSVFAANTKPGPAAGDAPTVQSLASLMEGLRFGVNHTEVTRIYNQTGGRFDREYDPILAKMQPGVRMQALEADRENRKGAFAASFLEFKDTPTGYDATGIKGEYTYRNHESVMYVDRGGTRRYFFFIGAPPGERFWKFYDEIPLKADGPLGGTYRDAIAKLASVVGGNGRVRAADPSQGIHYTTTDWQDGTTHLRAVDRSAQNIVGVVLEDRNTLNALAQLRANKAEDPLALDPSIRAITRDNISDPNATKGPAPAGRATTGTTKH